ncbi:hypothetical protein ACFXGT_30885 [Streptomyces sp. NPDC059352]|uniref:hypothetical protein n=1 Tax=Streptomyces sp. NPDC059352 TaxID=3346810 RepID=UPI0036CC0887
MHDGRWGPDEGEDPDVQVLLDGLDIFRTPADEILAHATRKGWHVNNDDPRAPCIPGVTLAFTRDVGHEHRGEVDRQPALIPWDPARSVMTLGRSLDRLDDNTGQMRQQSPQHP